jgi:hypothetical protein
MNASQLINQTSGDTDWYTPRHIVEAARSVLGGIDLDPASREEANRWIKATEIYTKDDDGLAHDWHGRVWMNHPFGRKENKMWIEKLMSEYADDRVQSACCITYACTSESWFQPLFQFPQCWLYPRLNYVDAMGCPVRGAPKGSVVTYLGPKPYLFVRVFGKFGRVTVPAEGVQRGL